MTGTSHAVFLSYASQDAEAAARICEGLGAAGVEVWYDKSELRGGDAWDQMIRQKIKACALFIPVISRHAHNRVEGYFRLEWKLAVDRSHLIAPDQAFLLPVVIDDTPQTDERIPDRLRELQWTLLPAGQTTPAFVERVRQLLSAETSSALMGAGPATLRPVPARTHPVQARTVSAGSLRSFGWWLVGWALAAALVYFVADRLWLSKRTASAVSVAISQDNGPTVVSEKSIAVLPFADMSEKHDQGYFADGMAEEILDVLVKMPELTVIGRTSSFQFKGRTENLRTIGEQLGASYVVEGSIRKVNSRIRVTAQLVETRSGAHLWSDSYERDAGDVLTLQDEIANEVARALQLTIGNYGTRPLRSAQARDAYSLLLKGQLALDKFEARSLLDAQNAFQQALVLDPTLVAAQEGLANAYLVRGQLEDDISGREAWEHAKVFAERSIQMDAKSAAAHGVLGFIAGILDYDWATAESEFGKALALNPKDPSNLFNAAQISVMRGRIDEAVQRINASLAYDPLNSSTYQILGEILYLKGDYNGAVEALRKSVSLNPEISTSHYMIGLIRLLERKPKEAIKEFAADADAAAREAGLASAYYVIGRKVESDASLARAVEAAGNTWPYGIAIVHAFRGDHSQAFEWLERAYASRDVDLMFVLREPVLEPLHDDSRWAALMKKMNLAD